MARGLRVDNRHRRARFTSLLLAHRHIQRVMQRTGDAALRRAALVALAAAHAPRPIAVPPLSTAFAGELFGPGQPLDANKFFIILPDSMGHGKSAKPSDGLRAKFPRYNYDDIVVAQYRLVTEGLGGLRHLRMVLGFSMA